MTETESLIVACAGCGARNRIPRDRAGETAQCGKCGRPIDTRSDAELRYTLRCTGCGTRNRVPAGRIDAGPVCGKCRAELATAELFAPQPMMITDANFESKVAGSPLPVLLYAWSPT